MYAGLEACLIVFDALSCYGDTVLNNLLQDYKAYLDGLPNPTS